MALNFDKFAAAGNEFINELAVGLDHPENKALAGRKLKAVLHALRNHLTIEESVQLMAQLPMFLKAVYVQNWSPKKQHKRTHHIDDFYLEVKEMDKQTADGDFPHINDVSKATTVVFYMLKKYVSEGELEDIKAVLPKELKCLVEVSVII